MLRVMTVIGTRPEAIKMAPIIQELAKYPDKITSVVCATGQHRQMLDQVFQLFNIQPDYDLNLMQPNQNLTQLTARVLTSFAEVIEAEKPDWVLVQGDTTTVMAASLVSYYYRVKVGHVEAGLRTGDKFQPFPEEINRRIADVLADLYFAPTEYNRQALLRENIRDKAIVVTGNTGIDALMLIADMARNQPLTNHISNINGKRLILVTVHRRENFGQPLLNICYALKEIAQRYADDVQLIYPVHPNPNILTPVYENLSNIPNISLIEPVDYESMVRLMMRAHFIMSDSGGIQEEAPSLDTPVLVLRETTERPEAVELGANKLVGTDPNVIIDEAVRLLEDEKVHRKMAEVKNPYGDGRASERAVRAILEYESLNI